MKINEFDEQDLSANCDLNIPVKSSIVKDAEAHLEHYSTKQRADWLKKLEKILDQFAESIGWTREVHRIGAVCTQSSWSRNSSIHTGPLLTDIEILTDKELQSSSAFIEYLSQIDSDEVLAFLIAIALITDRDAHWNDGKSVEHAGALFDQFRPDSARMMHKVTRTRKQKRSAAAKGGSAKGDKYKNMRLWVTASERRLIRDRTLSRKERHQLIFDEMPTADDGSKPSKRTIYRWLTAEKITL